MYVDAGTENIPSCEDELLSYVADNNITVANLNKYQRIYELFIKYNTPITSSAPVERVFSLAGILNNPRRNATSDTHFEQLLILKTSLNKKNPFRNVSI